MLRVNLLVALLVAGTLSAAPKCDPDNGGLKLPNGFCAFIAVDGIGPARHIAVAPNGDVYVALMGRRTGGGVVALRPDDTGHFTAKETFGSGSSTGIGLRNGYLYVATTTSVVRYKMTPGQLKPAGEMETVVEKRSRLATRLRSSTFVARRLRSTKRFWPKPRKGCLSPGRLSSPPR